jgi:putative transposase
MARVVVPGLPHPFTQIRAGIVERPEDYPWSSAQAHFRGLDDQLVSVEPLLALVKDWRAFLKGENHERDQESIRQHERTGRPLGSESFLTQIEQHTDRVLRKQKPGPKVRRN